MFDKSGLKRLEKDKIFTFIIFLISRYCIYMMEKFGDDYKKMAKDYKNYYQDTPAQLRKRIGQFKKMNDQYEKYLSEKKAGINFLAKLEESF